VQSSLVRDDNVREATEDSLARADESLRLLGELRLDAGALPLDLSGAVSVRLLSESFRDLPSEDRRQLESTLSLGLAPASGRGRASLEAGYGMRAYPDSTSRGHRRGWGRITASAPVGPRGSLVGRLDAWRLDFRSTGRVDRTGGGVDLSYEHPAGAGIVLSGGLELGAVHHGIGRFRRGSGEDPPVLDLATDRRDQVRFFHLGARRVGRLVVRAEVGYRSQASNSIDAALHRRELTWLVSYSPGWGVTGQFFGNLEKTTYTEAALRDFDITRTGDDLGENQNTVALRLARELVRNWDLEVRTGWYRNEGLLVKGYYRKQVTSVGLSWNFGSSGS
jgi:hypothetical protein